MNEKFYRASHILLSDKEDAEYVLEKLNEGASFEELASEFSECESAERKGLLGKFPQGTMVPEFERALSKMKTGEISPPVRSKYGFHIIKKLDL